MSGKSALITGITGQDGSYLADLLLEKGYEVHGMVRRSSGETFQRLTHIRDDIFLHTGDLLDQRSIGDVDADPRGEVVVGVADAGDVGERDGHHTNLSSCRPT